MKNQKSLTQNQRDWWTTLHVNQVLKTHFLFIRTKGLMP